MPSSPSARRYSGNRCFFLLLRVLRCFSSPGSPRAAMDSPCGGGVLPRRVSPFRNLRVAGYLPLAAAYRSLSRLSSALSAKASALCPYQLDHSCGPLLPSPHGGGHPSAGRLAWRPRLPVSPCPVLGRGPGCPCLPPPRREPGAAGSVSSSFRMRFSMCRRLPWKPMEMVRFELMTPCLQGRCSPN